MLKVFYCVVPLLLVVATWTIALGDNKEDAPRKYVSLERAILDFNEDSDADREKLGLTKLTEDEVLAAIRGTTGMKPEQYKLFTDIAESKKIPSDAKLILYRRHFANGYKSSIWRIVLYVQMGGKDEATLEVRNQYISTEKDNPFSPSSQTAK